MLSHYGCTHHHGHRLPCTVATQCNKACRAPTLMLNEWISVPSSASHRSVQQKVYVMMCAGSVAQWASSRMRGSQRSSSGGHGACMARQGNEPLAPLRTKHPEHDSKGVFTPVALGVSGNKHTAWTVAITTC